MEIINIKETEDTPKIILDGLREQFEISKKSFPEDAISFYAPIFDWLNKYTQAPNAKTAFSFRMDYFNTASSKQIYKILSILDNISKNNEVEIQWNYNKHDTDMLSSGERYSKLIVNLKFNFIGF